MPRGRPRKSAAEHFREGTYRPSRHGPLPHRHGDGGDDGNDPWPPLLPEHMPAWLSPTEAEEWSLAQRQAPWLRAVDRPLVTAWACAVIRHQTAMACRASRLAQRTPGAMAAYDRIVDQTAALLLKLAPLLGLTPRARRQWRLG